MLGMSGTRSNPRLPTDTAAPFGFTFGTSHTQSAWSDFRRMTWPQLVEVLTSHVPGPKEGSCIVPAQFTGQRRHKDDAARIDVVFLDSDAGMTLAEIQTALIARGWEAVVSSTHSHMSTRTRVKLSNWDKFFATNPDETAEGYLVKGKGFLPDVASGACAAETTDEFVYVEHQPCPKFRVALPLERPWRASDYPTQAEANVGWKERIEALAAALALPHDQSCTDTSRLFYLPRRPANGVVPETAVVVGSHCDIFGLPSAKPEDLLSRPDAARVRERPTGRLEHMDPETGEVCDLTEWAREWGGGFLIAKALKVRKPNVLTGHVADGSKVHIRCPNEGAHTQAGQDGATYVVDASASTSKGFVIHCRHAHCDGRDRLAFLKQMLEDEWLALDDLTAKRFLYQVPELKEPKVEAAKGDLPLLWFDDIEPMLDAKDFVQGLLMEAGAVVVYGESNAGKTFWATDLALHVSAGLRWCDKRVEQGGVVYCVLEGGIGFRNRVAAWKEERGLAGQKVPFVAIPAGLNLLDPEADTPRLVAAIKVAQALIEVPIRLVVIDTLSRAMAGGNENASEDMGALVQNMDTIRAETGACVMFIHHSGKDQAKGARGHSSLRAAVDTEIEVVAGEGAAKAATVVKQREMKKGYVFGFTLRVVELGTNRHGEAVTTCLVDYSPDDQAAGAAPDSQQRLIGHNKRALDVLTALIAATGRTGDVGVPSGCAAVPEKWWRDRFYDGVMPGATAEAKTKAFSRVTQYLIAEQVVGTHGGRVWIVSRKAGHHGQDAPVDAQAEAAQ